MLEDVRLNLETLGEQNAVVDNVLESVTGLTEISQEAQRLVDAHMSSRYLVLVSCKGGEDFFLLALRHFNDVKGAPKLGRDLVEFVWRDPEVTMRSRPTAVFPGFVGVYWNGPPATAQTQRFMNLRPGNLTLYATP
jgi:hypothetical protein